MYHYIWDKKTRGYKLQTATGKFVASEIRPVYAGELTLFKSEGVFDFDPSEKLPLLWGKHNSYIYKGEEVAKAQHDENGTVRVVPVAPGKRIKLEPLDVDAWISANAKIMDALVADTLKRIKEMYDTYIEKTDVCYIGFSGGKDSMVLLDLCHRVLPLTVPVVYSDTDMELPDSYATWELAKKRYEGRPFVMVRADTSAVDNWKSFGPPSKSLRWCCAVHKSTPAIVYLRELSGVPAARTLAYVGVRSDESLRRSAYDDVGDGLKSQSQVNAMPILNWGAQELFLYTYAERLIINPAYFKGMTRVGCILCPMSNERNVDIARKIYPDKMQAFAGAIRQTIEREFISDVDFERFIYCDKGWEARQSGVSLRGVIQTPTMKKIPSGCAFDIPGVKRESLLEWLKTVGSLEVLGENNCRLAVPKGRIDIDLRVEKDNVTAIECRCEAGSMDKGAQKYVRSSICKSLGCVGCRVCESECPTGALSFRPKLNVDITKCVHCMRCHSPGDGCHRYFSKRYAGGTNMNISGINKYMNFGMKREWINILVKERESFRSTDQLGNRMIPSAVTWFREAGLISGATSVTPTKLLEVAANNGIDSDNESLWSMLWISLANKSPLIKWFVCSTAFDRKYSVEELDGLLHASVASDSVRKGALQSLCSTLKTTSFTGDGSPVAILETKGPRVLSISRVRKSIDPFALLFSMYLIGSIADRTSFTVSEMLTADFDSPYVSPLVAFGMSAEEFKAQCLGLSSIHPDLLACSFTLGLDEIKIFPHEKTIDHVLGLILGE